MRADLEDLWDYYLIEVPIKNTEKEDLITKDFSKTERNFRSRLTDEQISYFEKYNDICSESHRISERHAFIKGVMFATRFIFQAMQND